MHDITTLHDHLKRRIARDGRRPLVQTIAPDPIRSVRSRRHCHLPVEPRPLLTWKADNGRFTPQLAAAIDDDPNLTDGARRCGRKIAEYTYRRNRDTRESQITVSYLVLALRRCGRTVQRYLRQLERAGYIEVQVVTSRQTRLCVGLAVQLLRPFFPKHHAQKWPAGPVIAGATSVSQNQDSRYKHTRTPRVAWAFYCCEAIHRSHMKTLSPSPPYPTI